MSEQNFDIVILGGGSGGYAAALRASQLGFTVALDRKGQARRHLPARRLHSDQGAAALRRGRGCHAVSRRGTASPPTYKGIDIAAVTAYREGIVASKYKGLQGLIKSRGITVIEGEGKLVSPTTVQVGDDTITGKNVVLATGSYSRSLPGLEIGGRVITSRAGTRARLRAEEGRRARRRRHRRRVLQRVASCGAEVTIIEALPHLVPNEDESVSKQFERAFRKRGIEFKLGVRFQSVTQNDTGVVVTLENGETVEAELLLVAVGRGAVHRRPRLRRGRRHRRSRLRHHQRAPGDQHPRRLRRRRHRSRPAARPPRIPAGHLRRRGDRRAEPGRHRGREHPQGHLLRPRGGIDRPVRGEGQGEVRRRQGHPATTTTSAATARARSSAPPAR